MQPIQRLGHLVVPGQYRNRKDGAGAKADQR